MSAPRFFADRRDIGEHGATLTGENAAHIVKVLRLGVGAEVTVCDGAGMDYGCVITSAARDAVVLDIVTRGPNQNEPSVRVTLFQGIPKGDKLDAVVQKAVELGVWRVVPVVTERAVAKGVRIDRLRKIAEAAAKQCGRGMVPLVAEPTDLPGCVCMAAGDDGRVVPWEEANGLSLKGALRDFAGKSLSVMIGPEGGLSGGEVARLEAGGFTPVTLGRRILRTETAGAAVLAMALYELAL